MESQPTGYSEKKMCLYIHIYRYIYMYVGFPGSTSGKEPASQCRRHKRHRFDSWVGKMPWRRAQQPTSVFLPGESHGQRSLEGYRPQGPQRVGND